MGEESLCCHRLLHSGQGCLGHWLVADGSFRNFGKGRGSGDFCWFSWDQRNIPALGEARKISKGNSSWDDGIGGQASCVLPGSQVQGAAGLVSTGPQPPLLLPTWYPGQESPASLSAPERPPTPQPSLDLCCPQVLPRSCQPTALRAPVCHIRPSSPLRLSSFHL